MLFSSERRILFVHIQKTGGKTVEHIMYRPDTDCEIPHANPNRHVHYSRYNTDCYAGGIIYFGNHIEPT